VRLLMAPESGAMGLGVVGSQMQFMAHGSGESGDRESSTVFSLSIPESLDMGHR
jgi:hypothetical protein